MLDQNPTPFDEDEERQSVLLRLLTDEHPAAFSPEEIRRRLEPKDPDSFHTRDGLDNGTRDLVSYGLAHYNDTLIVASQAAVRAAALLHEH